MAAPRRILFFNSILQQHREVQPLVAHCHARGHHCLTVIGWIGPTADEAITQYRAAGIEVDALPPGICYGDPQATAPSSGENGSAQPEIRLKTKVAWPLVGLRSFLHAAYGMWTARRHAERLMAAFRPDVVVLGPDHSAGQVYNGLLRSCRRRSIPTAIVPYSSIVSTPTAERSSAYRLADGMVAESCLVRRKPVLRLLAALCPRWTRSAGGQRFFRWEPHRMVLARILGLMEPEDPFRNPTHLVDRYFAPTTHAYSLLANGGFPIEKAVVSGQPRLDDILDMIVDPERRRKILEALRLRDGEPFILWNMEPSWEHKYACADDHWRRTESINNILKRTGLPVVISLHPLCHIESYRFLETGRTVISRQATIHDLIPLAALMVSHACSTNMIAPQFDIRLIIFDWKRIVANGPSAGDHAIAGAALPQTMDELEADVQTICRTLSAPRPPADRMPKQKACSFIADELERMGTAC